MQVQGHQGWQSKTAGIQQQQSCNPLTPELKGKCEGEAYQNQERESCAVSAILREAVTSVERHCQPGVTLRETETARRMNPGLTSLPPVSCQLPHWWGPLIGSCRSASWRREQGGEKWQGEAGRQMNVPHQHRGSHGNRCWVVAAFLS